MQTNIMSSGIDIIHLCKILSQNSQSGARRLAQLIMHASCKQKDLNQLSSTHMKIWVYQQTPKIPVLESHRQEGELASQPGIAESTNAGFSKRPGLNT